MPEPIPGPVSLRRAVMLYADVFAHPNKGALRALSHAATDPAHVSKLSEMASREGKDAYHKYITDGQRCILDVLRDHPSLKGSIPVGVFFAAIVPRLHPRYYSISSSPAIYPRTVSITCAAVDEQKPSGRRHLGVCSTYLSRGLG